MEVALREVEKILSESHPQFFTAVKDFQEFMAASQEDLRKKSQALKDQRNLIQARQSTIKNYLNCQIFMIARHRRRLDRFELEISTRLQTMNLTSATVSADMIQLLADVGKMKRRCKHILDVTDKFCVLSQDDLQLKVDHLQLMKHSVTMPSLKVDTTSPKLSSKQSIGSSNMSIDDTDSTLVKSPTMSELSASTPPVSLPSSITDNIVKSTLESFGSHLAVIAKTYTRKRGHELAENAELLTSPKMNNSTSSSDNSISSDDVSMSPVSASTMSV